MYLFLATDTKHKTENTWFVGVTKLSSDKIKDELSLDKKSGCVDFVTKSSQAKEILSCFQEHLAHDKKLDNTIVVKGTHDHLAQLLLQVTKDYEAEHPSFRRSMTRWLKSVDS